jgi:hypothetical protein
MNSSNRGANQNPGTPINTARPIPNAMACTAAVAAPRGSFSPVLRATIAVVDMLTPMATEKISVSIDSVSPTVATEFAPSRVTQNTSTMANSDSINISKTIGTARSRIALLIEP